MTCFVWLVSRFPVKQYFSRVGRAEDSPHLGRLFACKVACEIDDAIVYKVKRKEWLLHSRVITYCYEYDYVMTNWWFL